ncbi:uncharacterized protein BDZ99DRAFT_467383 [Mytilinidion resinicola]|uniref:Uncharacterized protein n=1 Tax=Mytilinidion resinicola TaxID=574789 RepID=A0A6A6Y786_9PEZI|nr:uncharacterized protein BDZ99DRAFT_467383 [Mytilinidion resinicola]KAF2804701.1 hypothetical protein BDZ99DRAFT_467383 [Mytilinidion resinicola]
MSQGSSIPNARYSTITNHTVEPPAWSSHPRIDRSTLTNCRLAGLSEKTVFDRSRLTDTTVTSSAPAAPSASISDAQPGKSRFDRSVLERAHVTDSHLDRSTITDSTLNLARADRSTVSGTQCAISNSRLDRSTVSDSFISGDSVVERSDVKEGSEVSGKSRLSRSRVTASRVRDETKLDRSTLKNCSIERSSAGRSTLEDCQVVNCRLDRTKFTGMRLANGRWERGNLIGRLGEGEVICERIEQARDEEKRERAETQRVQEPLTPLDVAEVLALRDGFLPDEKRLQPDAPDSLRINIEHSSDISRDPDAKREYVSSPISEAGTASSGVGWSTGLPDDETAHELETYDGPRTYTPPPPYDG